MKNVLLNKEANFSLHNIENYKNELNDNIYEITEKYSDLITEYYKFIIENIKTKNNKFSKFIILRGFDTITNVFLNLLFYTKNLDITYFHCQKSFYFYIEFVGQISEDEKMFLQLTSRDATTYVYKKTIFEIHSEAKKQSSESLSLFTKNKLDIINCYINIYKSWFNKILCYNDHNKNSKYIDNFTAFSNKLNINLNDYSTISILDEIIDKLYYLIDDYNLFVEINYQLVKKFIKTPKLLNNYNKKINDDSFLSKINESNEKFINWFLY
jgi:hypothetical protein